MLFFLFYFKILTNFNVESMLESQNNVKIKKKKEKMFSEEIVNDSSIS